jgi:hypothetical protein
MMNNNYVDHIDDEDFEEHTIQQEAIQQEEIDVVKRNDYSKHDLTASLLAFYAGKFTQCAFNLTLKLIQRLVPCTYNVKIPSSFNVVSKEILSWNDEHDLYTITIIIIIIRS